MPETGPMILRKARDSAGLTREQLEALMHVSVSTIKEWEYGTRKPDSSDVARLAQIVADDTVWPRWMCATDDEYARRHPFNEAPNQAIVAVINAGYQMNDVTALTDAIGRDLMDGRIDDIDLAQRYIKEAEEAAAALNAAVAKLKKGG